MNNLRELITSLIEKENEKRSNTFINVPLNEYVDKLITNATIISYTVEGSMAGFIAYYNNDPAKQQAFLTMVIINELYQGRGIGKLLVNLSLVDLERNGFHTYSLEVLKDNDKAIKLYENLGFKMQEDRKRVWLMTKNLK